MGKSSTFPRIPQDAYSTPAPAVMPLLERLAPNLRFIEPCCGEGRLIDHLESGGHVCVGRYDLPDDARTKHYDVNDADCFITNPPWSWDVLHPLIVNLSDQLPTWVLIAASWPHRRQSAPFLPRLRKILSIGRVKWIEDSQFTGKDDSIWALFDLPRPNGHAVTHFIGRHPAEGRIVGPHPKRKIISLARVTAPPIPPAAPPPYRLRQASRASASRCRKSRRERANSRAKPR